MQELAKLNALELLELFKTLEAPPFREMDGEYTAALLAQVSSLNSVLSHLTLKNHLWPGLWLAKAFRPINSEEGRGYNAFRHLGRNVQRFPMRTLIAPSRYDGKPAFQLVYRAYHSVCGDIHMIDELRCFKPSIYLIMGTCGFTQAQRLVQMPCVLSGPPTRYRGDIGTGRSPFRLSDEVPALQADQLIG